MSGQDRRRWDERHTVRGAPDPDDVGPPQLFALHAAQFPTAGSALEIACGQGEASVWLARRGLDVVGLDISPVAIRRAGELAGLCGVADRCRFGVVDLDGGLPAGPAVDVVVCHRFFDSRLNRALAQRLAPGGLLAIAALSGGRFGVSAGELRAAFAGLEVIAEGAQQGTVWLLARSRRATPG
ncbi:MAG: methyltransferase domain-containing protein [Mycobacterium sp.]|nr:methyltransferase domain-containing protein [Mycobacterium sp.]